MNTYTEGPWELDCSDNTAPAIVRAPYPHKLPGQPLPEWRAICQVYGPSPVREANARLIASAPELLAALLEVAGRLDRWAKNGIARGPSGQDADWPTLLTQIHDAIAKAQGR